MEDNPKNSIEDVFSERRGYWMQWIESMVSLMKNIDDLQTLQPEIYARRQEAVENYHNLTATLARLTKMYKEKYNTIYMEIKEGGFHLKPSACSPCSLHMAFCPILLVTS